MATTPPSKNEHAVLSPSSAHRWLFCSAAPWMESAIPQKETKYASEGTAAHEEAAKLLLSGGNSMDPFIQNYLNGVREESKGGVLLVEQRMSVEHITGEVDAAGTGDAVTLKEELLILDDLKYGRGVRVDAEKNYQLMIYALAALKAFDFVGDFKRVRHVIRQPRLGHVSTWETTVEDLVGNELPFIQERAKAALAVFERGAPLESDFHPCEKACRFCRASGNCKAQLDRVMREIVEDFEDLEDLEEGTGMKIEKEIEEVKSYGVNRLSQLMGVVPLLKELCKAVERRLQAEIMNGKDVEGWKVVEGKRGNAKWQDEEALLKVLKSLRIPQAEYLASDYVSPTVAKKKWEKTRPGWWKRISAVITRSPGRPTVVAATDKRVALPPSDYRDDFEEIEE